MTVSKNILRHLIPFFIVGASLVVSYAIVAEAQTNSISSSETGPTDEEITAKGITFPIPELGNCASKEACRSYCNQPGNMEACIKFAQGHGLMNKEEADRGLKFQKRILSGNTPGGCNSPESCKAVCGDINNLETCLKFADEHGFKEAKVDEARKILSYIKSGGQMPGGCNSEESCRSYCGDFSHAKECFEFAGKAGITQVEGGAAGHELLPEQFKKFIELAEKGETPGGCRSKEECESYCSNQSNVEACVAFGEKMGFIDEKKAELFRKTGGKGPGGCNSEESCRAYCNDPGNEQSCFKFAEDNGLIDQEEIKHAKEGFVRLRQGLENAPPEVAACLKSVLGANIIDDIQSGNLTPGPQIGERVKGCFEKFGHKSDAQEGFNQAPPEITSCVKEKLGDVFEKIKSGEVMPTPEMGDAFRVCGQQLQLIHQGPPAEEREEHQGGGFDVGGFLRSAPPAVANCLQQKLGGDFEKIKSGETRPGPEIAENLKGCFESFRPEAPPPGEFKPGEHEGVRPAGLQDFRNFIEHGGTSTPGSFRPDFKPGEESRPGLNRETFEKFRPGGGFQPPEGFKPPEGSPGQFPQQFQQQFQGEFQKQYEQQYQQQYQQYQKPPEGTNYPTAPAGTQQYQQYPPPPSGTGYSPPPSGQGQFPTSPPPSQ